MLFADDSKAVPVLVIHEVEADLLERDLLLQIELLLAFLTALVVILIGALGRDMIVSREVAVFLFVSATASFAYFPGEDVLPLCVAEG